MSLTDMSRFLSLILRHHPEAAGITLDEHGWANVEELLAGMSVKQPITMEILEEIVRTDNKQRYSFNEDKTLIRANQGHSIPVDVELKEMKPPAVLYHGTGEKYTKSIEKQGLIPKSRLYVHLSSDMETAEKVGKRHGKPVVYTVRSGEMYADGIPFFQSVNGVWLTKTVPVKYLDVTGSMTRAEKARRFFEEGYNCSQSVVLAFEDVFHVDRDTLLRMASPFGGGLGRLRQTCGCVSGMAMAAGALSGYSDPKAKDKKADLYALIQQLAAEFEKENGSMNCRQLLSSLMHVPPDQVDAGPRPEDRTPEYYKKRPCAALAASAAGILERKMNG